jgi:2'-5' RNA ligase
VTEQVARVFFALWPDATTRHGLVAARDRLHARLGGRPMRPDSLHMTLAFLGRVEIARLPELSGIANTIQRDAFTMTLDRCHCWRHNRIAWLGASQPPAGLSGLAGELVSTLAEAGFAVDRRAGQAFVPHVTLLRDADCDRFAERDREIDTNKNPAPVPLSWVARDFVLVRSSLLPGGSRYQQLGAWPLL